MRIILAFIYMAVGMWIYLKFGGDELHPYIGMAVGFSLMFSSVVVCNEGFLRRIKGQSSEEYIKELLQKGHAVVEDYKVSAAISFEDLDTGCLCHLLDIGENKCLCLYGQYLYEYSEIDDDPEFNQKRSFPTSSLSLIRNLKNKEIMDLEIGNHVIDEMRVEDLEVENLYNLGITLEDGEIIKNISFSKIIEACR